MSSFREMKFLCEKCFAPLPGTAKLSFPNMEKLNGEFYSMHFDGAGDSHLLGICPKCGEHTFFFTVDKHLANSIALLNQLGYKTEYSCQGHSNTDAKCTSSMEEIDKGIIHKKISCHYHLPYIMMYRPRGGQYLINAFANAGFTRVCVNGDVEKNYSRLTKKAINSPGRITFYMSIKDIDQFCKERCKKFEGKEITNAVYKEIDDAVEDFFRFCCEELYRNLKLVKKYL